MSLEAGIGPCLVFCRHYGLYVVIAINISADNNNAVFILQISMIRIQHQP